MRNNLKRAIDRLSTATNGTLRKPTSVRGGLEQPQRMQAQPAWVETRPRG
jgi:hypothetical protein